MPIIFIVAIIILVLLAVIGVYAWIRFAGARRLALDITCERQTFAEVDGFIDMLRGACEDIDMHQTLDKILTQPDEARPQMLY